MNGSQLDASNAGCMDISNRIMARLMAKKYGEEQDLKQLILPLFKISLRNKKKP